MAQETLAKRTITTVEPGKKYARRGTHRTRRPQPIDVVTDRTDARTAVTLGNDSAHSSSEAEEQQRLQRVMAEALAEADAQSLDPPNSATRTAARESAFGQGVREKFRRQGFIL